MASMDVDDLTKYYGDTRGVEGLTFTVEPGEVFGLLGPDGAGKTTTIRTLMGLQFPSRGQVSVLDHDISRRRERTEMKRVVGYLPSDPSFDDSLTGTQFLAYHASLKADERSDELLSLFGLGPHLDRPIGEYTPERKRLLATVVAFMHDPDLAVLDEPTAGLDPSTREQLRAFLHAEHERGTTLFVGLSDFTAACTLCDRIGILRNGHLVDFRTDEQLPDHGGCLVRFVTPKPVDADAVTLDHCYGVETDRAEHPPEGHDTNPRTIVRFVYTGAYETLLEHLSEYRIHDLTVEKLQLNEILTHWYGARLGTGGGGVNV